ncbi:hypothetical protein GOODEAATRI_009560 [Goodea atripinnis]|uniref:Myosin motor domain-containing protein n=1 Tax=Goodea atripinnis TaxID=208336 RepID=A0ABV0NM87_9TELE
MSCYWSREANGSLRVLSLMVNMLQGLLMVLIREEYRAEGILWHNIDYIDNSGCLNLISKKPTALFHLLDEECKEKNTDHMRPDIVALLKSSRRAFICGLMGIDPVATFRWAVLRAYFRAIVAFREAGRRHIHKKTGEAQLTVEPQKAVT